MQGLHIASFCLPLGNELPNLGMTLHQQRRQGVRIIAGHLVEAVSRCCYLHSGECLHRIPNWISGQLQGQPVGRLSLAETGYWQLLFAAIQQIDGLTLGEQQLIAEDGKQMLFAICGDLAIRYDAYP